MIHLAHAFSVIYVCLCSSAALFSISAHFTWPLSFKLPGQVTSSVPAKPLMSGHCFPPCPSARVVGRPPTFTRTTSRGSAGLSLVSQTSSGMCLRLHKPCMRLGTADTAGVVERAGWDRREEQQRLIWGLTHLTHCRCLQRVRSFTSVPTAPRAETGRDAALRV